MITPNNTPDAIKTTLTRPVAANDSLSSIVEIINPVFHISCDYLSVYLNDIKRIKTSTNIKIVKKSTKNK